MPATISPAAPRALVVLGLALAAVLTPAPARAAVADETALAERYAPVVRLVEQQGACGYGEPYQPMDVDALFGEPTVALRGPWNDSDLVRAGPSAAELSAGLYEYHLDFPGDPLEPGCDYETWARRLTAATGPTVYARVATGPGDPGKLALQYWFFYAFNDFNNTHEGDWEMIQLVFAAADAAQAMSATPVEVGYSQHEGAERAAWGAPKLELVDGTHPVVHVAAGSHANYFADDLYLGSSAREGVGCDDATGPTTELRPRVRTIPSDPAAARRDFPWIAFEGRWGELESAFYNGPTGPNRKAQWTDPIGYARGWRDHRYAVPAGGLLGTDATDFFCTGLRTASGALRRTTGDPAVTLAVLAFAILAALVAARRTAWSPSAPLRVARRRRWGQVLTAAARMYLARWRLFAGIGAAFVPIGLLGTLLQAFLLRPELPGEDGGEYATMVLAAAGALTVAGSALVQSATVRALAEIDAGRPVGVVRAYRLAMRRLPRLLGAVALAAVPVLLLGLTVVLLPVAIWLIVRWLLVVPAVELEGASAVGALRRSGRLLRGRWVRAASLAAVSAGLAVALGPTLGILLIFLGNAPFELVNVLSGVLYAVAVPLVALTTSYLYYDALVRERLDPPAADGELPAELPPPSPDRDMAQ